jgi:hypothetical protein
VESDILGPETRAGGRTTLARALLVAKRQKPLWAGAELVLIGPEAVSSGDDVLLSDEDSATVWENSTSCSLVGAGGVLHKHIPRNLLSTRGSSPNHFQGDLLWTRIHQLVATDCIEADVGSLHEVKKQVKVEEEEEEEKVGGDKSHHQPAADHSHRSLSNQ